ncbi:unnamed protein product [Coffea canephora]|uniref:SPRY domain-containing protein n=1 Tax=Coffea canephora TaxID=49390 RepID=A0A068TUJ8_COFCA|nr:unnamed protein product [Coffea canephora]
MASSAKRPQPIEEGYGAPWRDAKKGKIEAAEQASADFHPALPVRRVLLNPADCDIDFNIEEDGLRGSALYEEGFAYCWSGARANVGITGGKYCFGCKIIAHQPVDMDDTPLDQQHICRVGISRGDDAVGNLGETLHSFGFGGTGMFSNAGKYSGYGEQFDDGDTIICCVNLESKPMASIGFSKNGKWLGTAIQFHAGFGGLEVVNCPIKNLQWESALFPHVLLKNVEVQMQFRTEDGLVPQEGYKPWASAIEDRKVILGPTFQNVSDCELIMMVGLPAAGKSTWAENLVRAHPEKRYILLGTNLVLDQMKVPGLLRRHNYGERFDRLMQRATAIFNTLLSRASKVPRNFIIDQTNVYKNARKRKLKPFLNYHKIAVIVFPRPEELNNRSDKRNKEMGKEIPAQAVNEMLANYTLPMSKDMPNTDEYFDEVFFPELSRAESQRYLDQMKANLNASVVVSSHSDGMGFAGPWSNNAYSPYPPVGTPAGSNSYLCHGGYSHSGGSDCGNRFAASLDVNEPYRSYGAGYTSIAIDNNRMHMTEPYASLATVPFNSQDVYASQPRGSSHEMSIPSFGAPLRNKGSLPVGTSAGSNSYSYPINRLESYGSHGGYSHSGGSDGENRFAAPVNGNELYMSYGAGYTCSAADNNRMHMTETYASLTTVPFNSQIVYASQPQCSSQELLGTGPPTFGSTTAGPYGSPYGAPVPRPSYGNFPPGKEHHGGYGPPGPW